MKIQIFVARFQTSYGIGLSAEIAENFMLDQANSLTEPYREEGSCYPDLNHRGECIDFATEAMETYDKREKMRAEFRDPDKGGKMIRLPNGITDVEVDGMGTVEWKGAPLDSGRVKEAPVELTYSTLGVWAKKA